MGKINFVRKFISSFAEITKPINDMLKKDAKIVWDEEARGVFQDIKDAISSALVLTNPDYR